MNMIVLKESFEIEENDTGRTEMMKCPKDISKLLSAFADKRGEKFDPDTQSVLGDGYEIIGWDLDRAALIYTPACDQRVVLKGEDLYHPDDHYVISKDDLRRMTEEPDFTPPLTCRLED